MTKNFDPHCYDLAALFLDDVKGATEKDRNALAATIQSAIEDWLEDRESERQEEAESARDMAANRDGDEARDLGYDDRFGMYRGELAHKQDMARRLK